MPTIDKVDAVVTDPPYGIDCKYNSYKDVSGERYKNLISILKGMPVALLQYPEEMIKFIIPALGCPSEVMAWVYNSNLPRQFRLWGFWNCDIDPRRCLQKAKNPECSKVLTDFVAGYDWREFNQVKGNGEEKTAHPCQLPLGVADWVLNCLVAETILDPFMGSGTTGVACAKLGRKFIGIELDEDYFNIACERIKKAYEQPDLFVEAPKKIKQEDLFQKGEKTK